MKISTVKVCAIIFVLLLTSIHSTSQNLIVNPDFENSRKGNSQKDYWGAASQQVPESWTSIRSADYFRNSGMYHCDSIYPFSGNSFIGLSYDTLQYATDPLSGSEYAQATLTEPLVAGKQYHISFYVMQSRSALVEAEFISIYFSSTFTVLKTEEFELSSNGQITGKGKINHVLDVVPQIDIDIHDLPVTSNQWTKVSGTFTAEGGERFMTIGFFGDDIELDSSEGPRLCGMKADWRVCYYFLDAFYLSAQPGDMTPVKAVPLSPYSCDAFFDVGSDALSEESKKTLDNFLAGILPDDDLTIIIYGYADSTGESEENALLSQSRAEAVKTYIQSHTSVKKFEVAGKGATECDELWKCRKVTCSVKP